MADNNSIYFVHNFKVGNVFEITHFYGTYRRGVLYILGNTSLPREDYPAMSFRGKNEKAVDNEEENV